MFPPKTTLSLFYFSVNGACSKTRLVLEQALRKTGQIGLKVRPGFSIKSKEAVPKTEVLEQPQHTTENGQA
jgi:hypothetical protein